MHPVAPRDYWRSGDASFGRTEEFLKRELFTDTLMPSVNKRPLFPYKEGGWSWQKYSDFVAGNKCHAEVGVMLRSLCVIDVDSVHLTLELEKRFPFLSYVPTEETSAGKHYWFLRSALADDTGYFDGAAQRMKGIDFKSVSSTGTSGFVVIAPSPGKKWVRPLCNAHSTSAMDANFLLEVVDNPKLAHLKRRPLLAPIPDELLDYVAAPKHADPSHDSVELTFSCGQSMRLSARDPIFNLMSYFDAFFDELFDSHRRTGSIPVPCSRSTFTRLRRAVCSGTYAPGLAAARKAGVWREWTALLSDADFLGLRMDHHKKLKLRMMETMDIMQRFPDMWDAMERERSMREDASSRGGLIDLGGVSAPAVVSKHVVWDHEWLFGGLEVRHVPPGTNLLHAPPPHLGAHMENVLPRCVVELLVEYPGHLVLAGGSVLGHVCAPGVVKQGSDYDLFFVKAGDEADVVSAIQCLEDRFNGSCFRTKHSLTILVDDVVVQIIMCLNDSVASLLLGFDIAPARIGTYFCPDRSGFVVACAPTWLPAVTYASFVVELDFWGRGSVSRIIKYIYKGFNCFVPGGRRHRMVRRNCEESMQFANMKGRITIGRLDGLLAAESLTILRRCHHAGVRMSAAMLHRGGIPEDDDDDDDAFFSGPFLCMPKRALLPRKPLSEREVHAISILTTAHSDYDLQMKVVSRLKFVARFLIRLFQRGAPRPAEELRHHPQAGPIKLCRHRRNGMFYPSDPVFEEAYQIE